MKLDGVDRALDPGPSADTPYGRRPLYRRRRWTRRCRCCRAMDPSATRSARGLSTITPTSRTPRSNAFRPRCRTGSSANISRCFEGRTGGALSVFRRSQTHFRVGLRIDKLTTHVTSLEVGYEAARISRCSPRCGGVTRDLLAGRSVPRPELLAASVAASANATNRYPVKKLSRVAGSPPASASVGRTRHAHPHPWAATGAGVAIARAEIRFEERSTSHKLEAISPAP